MMDAELRWEILRTVLENYEKGDPIDLAEKCYAFVTRETVVAGDVPIIEPAVEPAAASEDDAESVRESDETAPVPRSLWAELSKAKRETLEAIAAVCEDGDGWCRTPDLRKRMDIKPGTLSVRLVELGKNGLIERRGRKYRPLTDQSDAEDDGEPEPGPAPTLPRSSTMRRFNDHKPLAPEKVKPLPADHDAILNHRTLFPSTVVDAADSPRLLVSGHNSRKTGIKVTKGPWAGMPIFTLTLEERATCPHDCHMWGTCYGNGMPMARRHRHGSDFEGKLARELNGLQQAHPEGYVVRLHILGDFYSVEYVAAWYAWLKRFPALRVFGYTAWDDDSKIGAAVFRLREGMWDRFAIRFSNEEPVAGGATTLWEKPTKPRDGDVVVCPAQTGATECCGTCGLCWHPAAKDMTIGFVAHGPAFEGRPAKPAAPEPAKTPTPAPRKTPVRQPAPAARPPERLTDTEDKVLRAIIRTGKSNPSFLHEKVGLPLGPVIAATNRLKTKGYLVRQGKDCRAVRLPNGEPIRMDGTEEERAKIEAYLNENGATRVPEGQAAGLTEIETRFHTAPPPIREQV